MRQSIQSKGWIFDFVKNKEEKGKFKNLTMSGFFLLLYYGAVNTALSYDTRGCDTPGCTATQSVLVFLRS